MKTLSNHLKCVALLLAIVFISTPSVFSQTLVQGNKNVMIVEHKVDNFSAIEVGGKFKVYLSKSDSPLVKIETDENLHDQVTLMVRDGTLFIGSKGMQDPTKLNAYIEYTELVAADVSGAATLKSMDTIAEKEFLLNISGAAKSELQVNVEQLISRISGVAKATIEGKANTHITEVSGVGNLHAISLVTGVTRAKVSGAGKAKVTATDLIDSDVSGAGRLEYFDGKSMVSIGKEGQFSIHIDEDIDVDSLEYVDIKSSDVSDSVHIRIGNLEIEVRDGEQTSVKVGPGKLEVDDTGKVEFRKETEKSRFNGHWAGLSLGINGYLTPGNKLEVPPQYSFLDLRYEKSINVHLNIYEQNFNLVANKLGLTTGLGIEWNNYRFQNDVKLDPNAPVIAEVEAAIPKNYTKSKLNVRYLNVPLILEFQTNPKSDINSFHIGAGIVGGLRIGSHTKNVYEASKRQIEKVRDDFHLNPLKADATVRVGWGKLNFYGNYSLISLFRKDKGPELYPFSVGLTLLSF